jgi:hypothetical protein
MYIPIKNAQISLFDEDEAGCSSIQDNKRQNCEQGAYRNPKQIQNSNPQIFKAESFSNFGFRASDLEPDRL